MKVGLCRRETVLHTVSLSASSIIIILRCIMIYLKGFHELFFFYRLLPLGVGTADSSSPIRSLPCIFLRHFHCRHVLCLRIHRPPFTPSPFPLSWQLHRRHPSPNAPSIFPPYMSKPPLSLASRTFSPNRPTCTVPLMYSFLILSILVIIFFFNIVTSSPAHHCLCFQSPLPFQSISSSSSALVEMPSAPVFLPFQPASRLSTELQRGAGKPGLDLGLVESSRAASAEVSRQGALARLARTLLFVIICVKF